MSTNTSHHERRARSQIPAMHQVMRRRIPQTVGHELVDTEPPQCSYAAARELTRLAFTVNSFDADVFGFLVPAALAGYLQEAAGRSADSLGCSLADLNSIVREEDGKELARMRTIWAPRG